MELDDEAKMKLALTIFERKKIQRALKKGLTTEYENARIKYKSDTYLAMD